MSRQQVHPRSRWSRASRVERAATVIGGLAASMLLVTGGVTSALWRDAAPFAGGIVTAGDLAIDAHAPGDLTLGPGGDPADTRPQGRLFLAGDCDTAVAGCEVLVPASDGVAEVRGQHIDRTDPDFRLELPGDLVAVYDVELRLEGDNLVGRLGMELTPATGWEGATVRAFRLVDGVVAEPLLASGAGGQTLPGADANGLVSLPLTAFDSGRAGQEDGVPDAIEGVVHPSTTDDGTTVVRVVLTAHAPAPVLQAEVDEARDPNGPTAGNGPPLRFFPSVRFTLEQTRTDGANFPG